MSRRSLQHTRRFAGHTSWHIEIAFRIPEGQRDREPENQTTRPISPRKLALIKQQAGIKND